MNYILLGIIIGILYSKFILPNKSKQIPKIKFTFYPIFYNGMIIIPFNKTTAMHIHHWLIYLFVLSLNIFFYIPDIINGFAIFLIIQGLCYNDCFEFITTNPYTTTT